MNDFVILTDSSCDLPAEMAAELGLGIIPLTVNMDGQTYENYLDWREMPPAAFYERVRGGCLATTSAINIGQFTDFFEPYLEKGSDILYLAFSGALSATYQNSLIAADDLRAKFPGRKIHCVDTLSGSLGQGLLAELTVGEKRRGQSFEQCRNFAENMKKRIVHWVTVDDLKYLFRGGRLTKSAATFGTILNIKPVMKIDDNGKIEPEAKIRGRKKSVLELIERTVKSAGNVIGKRVYISHADCLQEAESIRSELLTRGAGKVVISDIGPVIGAHAGPGALALFCLGEKR